MLFGPPIMKRYNILFIFFAKLRFFIVRTYMVQISLEKIRWESGFLRGGSMEPPLAPTGVKVPWSLKC